MINNIKCIMMLLGIILPTAFCHANSRISTEKDGGDAIVIVNKISNTGSDKSGSISASINGHTLTVVFTENLGNVVVNITNSSGALMNFASLETPTGYQFFISVPGRYTITFTLSNGDEYYGEFEVTE